MRGSIAGEGTSEAKGVNISGRAEPDPPGEQGEEGWGQSSKNPRNQAEAFGHNKQRGTLEASQNRARGIWVAPSN